MMCTEKKTERERERRGQRKREKEMDDQRFRKRVFFRLPLTTFSFQPPLTHSKTNRATLEYKLVALDGAGNPADWQLGENRVVEVKGGDGAGSSRKVVSISVEESWEGGEAAVEVRVEEEEEEKKVVSLPKPTAAAPVANAPAPAAFVQKEPAASVASAAAAAATAAAPVPKPWAASAAAPVAAPAAPSSSPSSPPSLAPRKSLSSLTVPQLKAKLKAAGLPTTGKKAELVARLEKGA